MYNTSHNVESLAQEMAGNWRKFDSFCWHRQYDIESPEEWTIVYTHGRDSGLVAQSNAHTIQAAMQSFLDAENPDVIEEHHRHWGWDFDAGGVTYYASHLPQQGCQPEDYTDDGIQAFLAVAWNYAEEHAGEPSPIGGMCAEIVETKNAGYADWELLETREVAASALVDCLLESGCSEDADEIKAFRIMAQECL